MDSKEMKFMNVGFEVKETKQDDKYFYFEGYASTFNNVDRGKDVVVEGAFRNTLSKYKNGVHDIVVLYQHKNKEPIGVPVQMVEDVRGLYVIAKLPKSDSLVSGRVIPQIEVGSLKSMSIGYTIVDKEIKEGITYLKELELWEFSVVTTPMNQEAVITGFKSLTIEDTEDIDPRKLEQCLKDGVTFSKNAAAKLVSLVKQGLQCEAADLQCEADIDDSISSIEAKELERKIKKLNEWRKQ